ncbi:hypothetical protein JVU11DRAFT_10841 [Chiua virens]|nr:hypothetical protein JVU11DRAFT_10841 [Chiua virens]
MDRLLENDTRRTNVRLSRLEDSTKFLQYLFPERLLLPKNTTLEDLIRTLGSQGHSTPAPVADHETRLAKFLNSVRAAVHKACGVSCFKWDAKSATKPLDGAYAARKPDITCYFETPDGISNRNWEHVVTFCEVKSQTDSKRERESFLEIAGKVSCLLGAQDGRHIVSCIRILNSSIYLTTFHRGGSISTCPFDINSSPQEFLRILIGVSFSDYSMIGFDTTIKWGVPADTSLNSLSTENQSSGLDIEDSHRVCIEGASDDEDVVEEHEPSQGWESMAKWMEITDKQGKRCKLLLRSILAISDSLFGRGSTVWEAEMEGDQINATVAVKDAWIDPLRKYTEGLVLNILEKHGIEGVPTLVSEEQVKTRHRDPERAHVEVNHSTHFFLSALPPHASDLDIRVLSRLVTRPVGKLVLEFSSLGELLVSFLDYIATHKNALEVAGILHRDVSLANLFLAFARGRTDHSVFMKHLSGEDKEHLCERIRSLERRGVLGDWGYAVPVTSPSSPSPATTSGPSIPPPDAIPSPDDLPTLPIEPVKTEFDNCVPARKVGSDEKPTLVSVSDLTADHDIVLLMGADNPEDDPRQTIDLCPLYRTGTWSWMSSQLVMAGPGQPVVHDALHDLESFFYVLVGICVLYDSPSKQKREDELADCYDKFFNTYEPSVMKTIFIQSDLTWVPYIVEHISPYFQPLVPLLTRLRTEIILPLASDERGSFYRKTCCDHDTFIKHIVTALSELPPECWDGCNSTRRSFSEVNNTRAESNPPSPLSLLAPPALPKNLPPGRGTIRSDSALLHMATARNVRRAAENGFDDFIPLGSTRKRPRLDSQASALPLNRHSVCEIPPNVKRSARLSKFAPKSFPKFLP